MRTTFTGDEYLAGPIITVHRRRGHMAFCFPYAAPADKIRTTPPGLVQFIILGTYTVDYRDDREHNGHRGVLFLLLLSLWGLVKMYIYFFRVISHDDRFFSRAATVGYTHSIFYRYLSILLVLHYVIIAYLVRMNRCFSIYICL